MTIVRALLAFMVFITAIFFTVQLFTTMFSWAGLLIAIICFIVAYLLWPSKKQGQRHNDNWLLDVLEIFIELPVEVMLWLLRFIGGIFRGKDGGIDIDF